MKELRCPRCGQRRGRRAARAGALERALSRVYVYPFRCQLCGRRFHALQWGQRYARVDRRDSERVAVRLSATVAGREGELAAEVTDLSLTGCGVKVDAHPVTGDRVTLGLRLAADRPPVAIAATVRSVHTGGLGLEFVGMAEADRHRLRRFLSGRVVAGASGGAAGRRAPSAAAVGLIALVILVAAFLVARLWPAITVCVWGRTC